MSEPPEPTQNGPTENGPTEHKPSLLTVGWREWVALPELGIGAIKAKVDTGARSSSLHAANVETFARDGKRYVRFKVYRCPDHPDTAIAAEAELLEFRQIRSSTGHQSLRPVVRTVVRLLGQEWEIELTLADRDTMGFRMLLGRQALRGRFVVDSGRSYLGGRRKPKHSRGPRSKTQRESKTE